MKRTGWLFLNALLVAGCSGDGAERSLPLPGASAVLLEAPATALPGAFAFGTVERQSGCRTRYEFAAEAPFECTTELVGGDALHWLRRCPDHPGLALEDEVRVDALGRPLATRRVERVSADQLETYTTELSYDAAGRLTSLVSQPGGRTTTVDAHAPDGQPTHAVGVGAATAEIPGSDRGEMDLGYDARGRLVARHMRYTGSGAAPGDFWAETIAYDDAAGRIDHEVDITLDGQTGVNVGFLLFDADNHVVADHWARAGDPAWDLTYSYDAAGQLLTTLYDDHRAGSERQQYVAHEIRDCP